MFLDEEEIRRSLSRRAPRTGEAVWSEIRRRLESHPPRARTRLALAAVVVVLVSAAVWLRQPAQPITASDAPGAFQVSRVESRGKPSAALILQPDGNTLMVVVPD